MPFHKNRTKSVSVKGRKSGKYSLRKSILSRNAEDESAGIRNADAALLNEEHFSNWNDNSNGNSNIQVDNLETLTKRYANTNLNNDLQFVVNENNRRNHNENIQRQQKEIADEIESNTNFIMWHSDPENNYSENSESNETTSSSQNTNRDKTSNLNYRHGNGNGNMQAKNLGKINNLYYIPHTKRRGNKRAIKNATPKTYFYAQQQYNITSKATLDKYLPERNLNPYPEELFKKLKPSLQYNFSFISQTLPLTDIQTIVGPFSVNLLRLDYDNGIYQNFFIFGEQHELDKGLGQRMFKPESTVAFDGFIKAILGEYSSFNFDLYLEQDYFPQNAEENVKSLNKYAKSKNINTLLKIIQYTFLNCMPLFDKSKCEYKNLRIHIADFRKYYLNIKLLELFYHKYEFLNNAPEDLLISVNKKLTEILELERLEGSKIIKQKQGINEDFINIIDRYFDDIFNNPELTTNNIISKITGLMDKYTILRMLRAFDETKETMGRTKHWNQTNIFGYFGNNHSKNICNILRQLGAQTILTKENTNKKYNSYINLYNSDIYVLANIISMIVNYDSKL